MGSEQRMQKPSSRATATEFSMSHRLGHPRNALGVRTDVCVKLGVGGAADEDPISSLFTCENSYRFIEPTMTLPMLAPTLLLAVLGQPPDGIVHPSVSAVVGYGTYFTRVEAACIGDGRSKDDGLCNPTSAQGLGLSLGGQLLLGRFVRAGVEVELGTTLGSGTGRTAAALGVVRVGWDVFADVGVGVGYAWAHRSKSFGDVSGGDVGGALGVRAGARITDALAIIARTSVIDRYRAPIFLGVGIEWQL
jgi:hypothetical protein